MVKGGFFGIRSIMEDEDGYLWICNRKYKYNILTDNTGTNALNSINYQRGLGIERIESEDLYFLSMTLDDTGDLWMVTYDNGVWRRNGKELIHYPVRDGEGDMLLSTICKDRQGELWVGTQHDGVYRLRGDNFDKFVLRNE